MPTILKEFLCDYEWVICHLEIAKNTKKIKGLQTDLIPQEILKKYKKTHEILY